MILDMDTDAIKFPKEFLQEAGRRNLLGCRYPVEWGGRGMDWVTTCLLMEEVGTLGYETCLRLRRGRGTGLRCHHPARHGCPEERFVKPLLRGERFAAECLTGAARRLRLFRRHDQGEDRATLPSQRSEAIHRGGRGG